MGSKINNLNKVAIQNNEAPVKSSAESHTVEVQLTEMTILQSLILIQLEEIKSLLSFATDLLNQQSDNDSTNSNIAHFKVNKVETDRFNKSKFDQYFNPKDQWKII